MRSRHSTQLRCRDAHRGQTPSPRLDLAIGGSATNDPSTALLRIFGDDSVSAEDACALRAQRAGGVDKVLRGFGHLAPQAPADDGLRLE